MPYLAAFIKANPRVKTMVKLEHQLPSLGFSRNRSILFFRCIENDPDRESDERFSTIPGVFFLVFPAASATNHGSQMGTLFRCSTIFKS